MTALLRFLIALASFANLPALTPTPSSPHELHACSVRLVVPAGWEALFQPEASDGCMIWLRASDWLEKVEESAVEYPDFPMSLTVFSAKAARFPEIGGFSRKGDTWIVHGRQMSESGAKAIRGSGWKAWVGYPQIGMHYKESGNAGLGDTIRILIHADGGRVALVNTEACCFQQEAMAVLESLRFEASRKR
jgi:hypothetical protein